LNPVEIYLLRHGRTTRPGTFTGITDIGLAREGEKQIRKISPLLEAARIEACYCSPLSRCRDTLRLIVLNCEVTFDEALKEIDFGVWEGMKYSQILSAYPEEAARWDELRERFTFPGGASISGFNRGVWNWFDKLLNCGHERVLVVAHGGVLREGLRRLLGLDADCPFGFNIAEGGVSRITIRDGQPCLEYFNCRG
jgi:alpha-ribazole phosphatase